MLTEYLIDGLDDGLTNYPRGEYEVENIFVITVLREKKKRNLDNITECMV